jgi:hypothetical protein
MWTAGAFVVAAAAILAAFQVLQWYSDRTYRPSQEEVRRILEASLEGRLSLLAFDEFSCVRIAYDSRLDHLRERSNAIVNDPGHMLGEITKSNATPLNEQGRARLRELISELDALQA